MTLNTTVRRGTPFSDDMIADASIPPGRILRRTTADNRVGLCGLGHRPIGVSNINYRVGRTGIYAVNDTVPCVFGEIEVNLLFRNSQVAATGVEMGQTLFTAVDGHVDVVSTGATAVGTARETIAPIAQNLTAPVRVKLVI